MDTTSDKENESAEPVQAYVMYCAAYGIYLGQAFGMGFWTKLDPVGQPAAVAFPTEAAMHDFVATWDEPISKDKYRAVPVQATRMNGQLFADIAACEKAGLPTWTPNAGAN